jgi:hypothetical protein
MPVVAAAACAVSLAGCERKERVLDIEAPGVDIEVNKTKRGVEVETRGDKAVDIEAPGVDIEVRRNKK